MQVVRKMSGVVFVAIFSLVFFVISFMAMTDRVHAQLPSGATGVFGGIITDVKFCNCSLTYRISVLHPLSPRPKIVHYVPNSSIQCEYYNITTPGVWTLGIDRPVSPCLIWKWRCSFFGGCIHWCVPVIPHPTADIVLTGTSRPGAPGSSGSLQSFQPLAFESQSVLSGLLTQLKLSLPSLSMPSFIAQFLLPETQKVLAAPSCPRPPPPPAPPPPPPDSPTCTLSISDSTLSWTSTNAVTGSIDNGVGVVTPVEGGSVAVKTTSGTTFTGTFIGKDGSTVKCHAQAASLACTLTATHPIDSPPVPPTSDDCGDFSYVRETMEAIQCPQASDELKKLLQCMSSKLGGEGTHTSITAHIMEHENPPTFEQCVTNDPLCPHVLKSCHYGGRTCVGESYAADFAEEQLYDDFVKAAQECNPEASVLRHPDSLHVSIGRASGCGCDAGLDPVGSP